MNQAMKSLKLQEMKLCHLDYYVKRVLLRKECAELDPLTQRIDRDFETGIALYHLYPPIDRSLKGNPLSSPMPTGDSELQTQRFFYEISVRMVKQYETPRQLLLGFDHYVSNQFALA